MVCLFYFLTFPFLTNYMKSCLYNDYEKRHDMVYELYVDTLFLINFVMNLYLLILVNKTCMRTATRMRILAGAGVGAIAYTTAFLVSGPGWLKWPIMLLAGTGLMLRITFRPQSFRSIMKLFGQLAAYSFLMGGLLLFLGNATPLFQRWLTRATGVIGLGAVVFMLLGTLQERKTAAERASVCSVKLITESGSVEVEALIDSGNSLTEPISGKPVSVIDKHLFAQLWPKAPELYRVVPYQSVGKAHGILKGYPVPEMEVEIKGIPRQFFNVYVAVCEGETISGMILNPRVLCEAQSGLSKTNSSKIVRNLKLLKRKERVDRNDS